MTPEARRRQKNESRRRRRDVRRVHRLDIDEVAAAALAVGFGLLTEAQAEDPRAVETALAKIIDHIGAAPERVEAVRDAVRGDMSPRDSGERDTRAS